LKIVLAHPGVGPFVQQTARALLEADLLASYWTTFADQPKARWRRTLVQVASAVGLDIERELRRRAIEEVPSGFLKLAPYWEVLRSLLAKMKVDARLVDAVWEHGILKFDHRVAKGGLKDMGGIYGYEYSALASFQEAERRGLARIYEVPAPEHDFVENLIQREIKRFPELNNSRRAYFLARQQRRTVRRRQEWDLADVVIVNSKFTRDTYDAAGLDVSRVRVIPLGAPQVHSGGAQGGGGLAEPLRAMWAGGFSVHKGAHYLLSAWRGFFAGGKAATLDIFGTIQLPDKLMHGLPSSVRVFSSVPRAELFMRYREADVLVFPTLCDGFGMVVTEAFAHGLPVVTTKRAGAAELVRHGENGLIIPAGDAGAITEALDWCLTHRIELKAMRRAALETAARWQWRDFRQALAGNVIDGLRQAGYAA
jgi:glycosyltransferase involved in cell wall biosynthesis